MWFHFPFGRFYFLICNMNPFNMDLILTISDEIYSHSLHFRKLVTLLAVSSNEHLLFIVASISSVSPACTSWKYCTYLVYIVHILYILSISCIYCKYLLYIVHIFYILYISCIYWTYLVYTVHILYIFYISCTLPLFGHFTKSFYCILIPYTR